MLGLLAVMYIHILTGATGAIQPAAVIYFVVIFTQPADNYVAYTIARIIDTGIGATVSLAMNCFFPSKMDDQKGMDLTDTYDCWKQSHIRPEDEQYPGK